MFEGLLLALGVGVCVLVVFLLAVWVFCKLTPCGNCPEGRRYGCVVACPDLSRMMDVDDSPAPPVRGGAR